MAAEQHELPPAQLDEIFTREIVPALFENARPSERPVLILVGGQPGSGKTRAATRAASETGQDISDIIGDDLRVFHPDYPDLLAHQPAVMPAVTAQASGAWVERSCRYAAQNRFSALVEGTFRDPKVPLRTARMFADAGFRVEAHLLAVAPEVSRLSMAARFVKDEQTHGAARFTPLAAHEDAFNGIPATIDALTARGAPVDRIVVRSRDKILHDLHRHRWRRIRGVHIAARSEWTRRMNPADHAAWMEEVTEVIEYLRTHHGHDGDVVDLINQLEADRETIRQRRARNDDGADPFQGAGPAIKLSRPQTPPAGKRRIWIPPHRRGGKPVRGHWRDL